MNKSTFFNHSLMKRRYSEPETVMRKHKLQETLSRKRNSDQQQSSEPAINFKDESCQTEESDIFLGYANKLNSSHKKPGKGKRRESVRCFRKANSYCQYKSLSMFHKRMIARTRDAHSMSSLENLQSDDTGLGKPSAAEIDGQCKSNSENTITRSGPVRQFSDPPRYVTSTNFCGTDTLNERCNEDTVNATAELLTPRYSRKEQFDSRKVLVNSKSMDQSTSGYNTVSGSLDDTPRKKTPESLKPSPKENNSTGDLFPITFHSESVFLHPYQKGFLSHKELHHISIQVVPDMQPESSNDYYKTEIKLNVNDGKEKDANPQGSSTRTHSAQVNENKVQTERDALHKTEGNKVNELDTEVFGEVIVVNQETADTTEKPQKTDETECSRKPELTAKKVTEESKSLVCHTVEKTEQSDTEANTRSTLLTKETALPKIRLITEETDMKTKTAEQLNKTEARTLNENDKQLKEDDTADTRQQSQFTDANSTGAGTSQLETHTRQKSPDLTESVYTHTNTPQLKQIACNTTENNQQLSDAITQHIYGVKSAEAMMPQILNSTESAANPDSPQQKRIEFTLESVSQKTAPQSTAIPKANASSVPQTESPEQEIRVGTTAADFLTTLADSPVAQVVSSSQENHLASTRPTATSEANTFRWNISEIENTSDSQTNSSRLSRCVNLSEDKRDLPNHYYSMGRRDSDDCSVPTTFNPVKLDEPSKLKIEVDVGNVDFSTSLQDLLLGRKLEHKAGNQQPSVRTKPAKRTDKYNSKTALNYLFQKLGDSYPKRYLLKQPAFQDYSQYGRYYSDLPKIYSSELPPQVLYNNQAYDILSGHLLPNERSNLRHTPLVPDLADIQKLSERNDHSDSDISIPDSLEDFQQTKRKSNKYQKYDQRLARGGLTEVKPPAKASKKEGISYFIPLAEDNVQNVSDMPPELKAKLCKRSNSISKHSSCCAETHKKSPRTNKLIHKQIQTCLNAEDSLKKRRKKMAAEASNQTVLRQKSESELDERIADILMTGLKLQDAEGGKNNPEFPNRSTSSQSAQTESVNAQPVISEYVELYKVQTTSNDFKPTEQGEFFDEAHAENDNVYEVILSEEETGRINSTNYYRTFKKSRRIYYPTKDRHQSDKNDDSSSRPHSNHAPVFSKYQRRLKEFKQQTRRQIQEKTSPPEGEVASNGVDNTMLVPVSKAKKTLREKTIKTRSHTSKIPGPRNHRFYQRFEAIPEELSNSSSEQPDPNANSVENSSTSADTRVSLDANENECDGCEKGIKGDENGNTEKVEVSKKPETEDEYPDKLKSQKGRDSLSIVNEHEELITLSKGWINFYLLKGNSAEENSVTEELEGNYSVYIMTDQNLR